MDIKIDEEIFPRLLGVGDCNLRYIEDRLKSKLTARDGKIAVRGPAEEREKIKRVFVDLEALARDRREVSIDDLDTILMLAGGGAADSKSGLETGVLEGEGIVFETPRGPVRARTPRQEQYIKLMTRQAIVFANGPAGTGKTYLAVAYAVDSFQRRLVDRIILVRPVVETGETLGFLPGDILEKVNPYFRPLYDALDEMISPERVKRFIDRGLIEVAPLAYMRGRTLNSAIVILDEAQNTTSGQMKMFLTRLGRDSKAVLTGDVTQIDLPDPSSSGMLKARELLRGIEGIGFMELTDADVVRHKLVASILRAYQSENNAGRD